jgi:hypothetical protein
LANLQTTALFGVIALCLIQHANAGSAVAVGRNLHLVYSFGWPKQVAEQRALAICRRQGGLDPRIVDSTDAVGYGAAAISYQGNHWILGVATGHPTWLEAEHGADFTSSGFWSVTLERSNKRVRKTRAAKQARIFINATDGSRDPAAVWNTRCQMPN